jgi:signal-transduction protein with cAMP-binding, CBS, and nucleotidyltransferase domain
MYRLSEVLKDRNLFFVEKHQTVCDVARRMAALNVGAILVLENGQVRGIFSERDLLTRVVVAGMNPDTTQVGRVMSTDLATIEESASSEDAMEMMRRKSCRHLPVMRGPKVVGMVSMRDLMHLELESQTEEIQQMRAYIHGSA